LKGIASSDAFYTCDHAYICKTHAAMHLSIGQATAA
jgi:hypothetical protein